MYQALRIAVTDAVQTLPGTDSDRASYQIAVGTAQMLVTSATNVIPQTPDLAGDIGRAVLASLHGPRRPRVCARTVKSPLGRWATHPPGSALGDLRALARRPGATGDRGVLPAALMARRTPGRDSARSCRRDAWPRRERRHS